MDSDTKQAWHAPTLTLLGDADKLTATAGGTAFTDGPKTSS
jgi:hypothetical protein